MISKKKDTDPFIYENMKNNINKITWKVGTLNIPAGYDKELLLAKDFR